MNDDRILVPMLYIPVSIFDIEIRTKQQTQPAPADVDQTAAMPAELSAAADVDQTAADVDPPAPMLQTMQPHTMTAPPPMTHTPASMLPLPAELSAAAAPASAAADVDEPAPASPASAAADVVQPASSSSSSSMRPMLQATAKLPGNKVFVPTCNMVPSGLVDSEGVVFARGSLGRACGACAGYLRQISTDDLPKHPPKCKPKPPKPNSRPPHPPGFPPPKHLRLEDRPIPLCLEPPHPPGFPPPSLDHMS